jgi:hypothetical protein
MVKRGKNSENMVKIGTNMYTVGGNGGLEIQKV